MLNNYGVELSKSFNTIWMLQYQILYKCFYFLRNQWKKIFEAYTKEQAKFKNQTCTLICLHATLNRPVF